MRLLVVEDDERLAALLTRALREQRYAVDCAGDARGGAYMAAVNEYDVVILDVGLPGGSGLDLCRELRHRGSRVPVLMLTARDALRDRVAGLDSGADDYLVKPFELEELYARLRALLRRQPAVVPRELTIGDLVIDTHAQHASRQGRDLALTAREYTLLEYMARHAGRVIGRAELTEHVWDENHDPASNALEVYINRLRRKLERDGGKPMIFTRRGAGYLLALPDAAAGTRTGVPDTE
jgi:two-component system copper resistance phosphate regulon response regulator CusR